MGDSTPRIAIIGAGLAGLSCAKSLTEAGFTVRVFDKSRGPGGRMSTRRADGWQCDHGAQYFTARDPGFLAEVGRWITAGVAAPWRVSPAVLGGDDGHRDMPGLVRYVGTPGMSAPAHWLAANLNLRVETTVTALTPDAQGWRLHAREVGTPGQPVESDGVSRFDAVVLAMPAPQAEALVAPHSRLLTQRAATAEMRPCWSLMLRYPAPLELPFTAAFVNAGPLRWIARDSAKPGRRGAETWLLHADADWSAAHRDSDPALVAERLQAAFAAWGAPNVAADWTAHRWLYAQTDAADPTRHAWDARQRLGMAGDWLAGGRVEGAWLSGMAIAARLVNVFSGATARA